MKRIFMLLTLLSFSLTLAFSQATINVTDASIQAGQSVTWTKNNTYLLDGLVFVESGATLTIEAGTVVKFTPRADQGNPSALVITRGAKIFANGTAAEPIIFTAQADDVNNPTDLGPSDVSLWGGLVVLGSGITQKNGNAEASVEGIPTTETRGIYGGTNNDDNSGVLRYISIRHGGRILTGSNELNGLTLAGVGSKTTLEYIEVYANSDDGIEFFGGAPYLKHAIVAFAEDDSFDWDEVYTGKGQFWFSIQRADAADAGGELDGTTPDDATPYSAPVVYNWTHIGTGRTATAGGIGWLLRAGTAGTIANSIITDLRGKVIEVQDKNAPANDAHQKLLRGELKILNNLFWDNGATAFTTLDANATTGIIRITSGQATQDNPSGSDLANHLVTNKNAIANPGIRSISRTSGAGMLDPRPSRSGAAYSDLAALPADPFFEQVDFKGAFGADPQDQWMAGWSTLARNGHLRNLEAAGSTINITDADLVGGQTYNWTKNNTYLLDGLVFLEPGGVLNIEPGTVVKFTPRADQGNPSALVITSGAKIFADGRADAPIIFTAQADDVSNPNDLGPTDVSLWGGLVILGKGITQKNGNATASVEGIPTTETRGIYGGTDNADNSGVLRYISIRHGGRILTGSNELNGLTLAGVGSGTILEYIEVYANSDDGIEFFGGAPNLKYAIVAFAEDDSYDWDEVYVGKGQFWFSIQRADAADAGGELDGTTPDDATPYSNPVVYNWTHIGTGRTATAGGIGWLLRAGTAGTIANSIVTDLRGKVIEVQDKNTPANDAHQKLLRGELKILNNLFWDNGATAFTTLDANATTGIIRVTSGQATQDNPSGSDLANHLVTNKNAIANPGIRSISRAKDGKLDPRPLRNGAAYSDLAAIPADPFFERVDFKGAVGADPQDQWMAGWSALARNGHLGNLEAAGSTINITDADLVGGQTYNWTKNNTYLLDGLVFLEPGGVLNIEPGTVVKFTPRADQGNPSALVITSGAKIFADGRADAPIIFTAQADDVNNPNDLGPTDVSLWGGLVILGKGITQKNGNATASVEGIPTTETRGIYGGTDNADNSGVLRYISIRHGGRILTGSNELNGLTLAGVGSGTILEYIEVYANSDDGIEFFGGAPNLKYAIVAFAEDDSYDWDEVYVGKGQFWFSIQRADAADAGGELDGTTPDDATPYSNPVVYNWTHIGTGRTATAGGIGWLLRAGTAGIIANSIVTDLRGKVLEVQDKNAPANDAHQKLLRGELKILNNLFWNNGATAFTTLDANATTGVIRVTSGQATQDNPSGSDLASHLVTNQNAIADPILASISRAKDHRLDPRPALRGAAYTTPRAALPANDPFFTNVPYKGAFANELSANWMLGWSTLDRNGHLGSILTDVEDFEASVLQKFNIYPNPTADQFTLEFNFDEKVRIDIFSIEGRLLRTVPVNTTGFSRVDMAGLNRGVYLVKFTTESGKFAAKKLIVE